MMGFFIYTQVLSCRIVSSASLLFILKSFTINTKLEKNIGFKNWLGIEKEIQTVLGYIYMHILKIKCKKILL